MSLPIDEAIAQLVVIEDYDAGSGPCPCVHTFRGGSGMLLGAHWLLAEARAAMEEFGVEESGLNMVAMGHGLVTVDGTGPVFWETKCQEPSLARKGINRLLKRYPAREILSIDSQPERPLLARDVETGETSELTVLSGGPWVLVKLGDDEFAVWKETGAVYRVGADGAVAEDPFIEVGR